MPTGNSPTKKRALRDHYVAAVTVKRIANSLSSKIRSLVYIEKEKRSN
jgi:hypothetical protein